MPVPTETANEKKEMETMIFGLHPLFGFLPLLLYIVLMMMGKDMNVSVLLCVILGAILTGESITGLRRHALRLPGLLLCPHRLHHRPGLWSGGSPVPDKSGT